MPYNWKLFTLRIVTWTLLRIISNLKPLWGFKGNLWYCLLSDSIPRYSILTPRYLAGLFIYLFIFWIWKLQRNYMKEDRKKGRRPRYLLYSAFIPGFNSHLVGEEILPEYKWNGCVSQLRSLNVSVVLGYICPNLVFKELTTCFNAFGRCV